MVKISGHIDKIGTSYNEKVGIVGTITVKFTLNDFILDELAALQRNEAAIDIEFDSQQTNMFSGTGVAAGEDNSR